MQIELTDNEVKLIKEALTNNSIQYAYKSDIMKDINSKWSEYTLKKSNDMTKLLYKLETL